MGQLTPEEEFGLTSEDIRNIIREYGVLKTAEADGRLFVLPFRIGTELFSIVENKVYSTPVCGYRLHEWATADLRMMLLFDSKKIAGLYERSVKMIGKTVFTSREDAENTLATMRGDLLPC